MRLISFSILRLGAVLLLAGSGPAMAQDQWVDDQAPVASPPGQPLRLAEPQRRPLTSSEIRALLSDRKLVLDGGFQPSETQEVIQSGGCPPYETFFRDGRWRMDMCQRAYRVYEGRWTTEAFRGGERLCVEAGDYPKRCRFVWQGRNADQIIMPLGSPVEAQELNGQYSPYRLRPLDLPRR